MRLLYALAVASVAFAAPSKLDRRTPTRSYPRDPPEQRKNVNAARASAVSQAFQIGWSGYYEHAFPNDELKPQSNGFENSYNGWGATAVDALDTAAIMGLDTIVRNILNYIPKINFHRTYQNEYVSLFETTIRYLGGMLSAYDLLTGPLASMATNMTSEVNGLVQRSQDLADALAFAFDTPTGIPFNNLYVNNKTFASTTPNNTNGLATIGSLVLEWTHLSDLSGKAKHGKLTQKAESYLLNPKPAWAEPFPGLVGSTVNITTGEFIDADGGWASGDDSFYEYLIKMYVYDPSRFGAYKDRWVAAADSTIKYLTSHPRPLPNLTYLAEFSNTTLNATSDELVCFDGGNFILGGLALGQAKYVDYGLDLVAGCYNIYNSTATGLGPVVFGWNASVVPPAQKQFFREHGFYIEVPSFSLRPEFLESLYYAYRATGDARYQDWSWQTFLALNATTRVGSGYSAIKDVTVRGGGGFVDIQESFFLAEVLKYAYLIHTPDAPYQISRRGPQQFVFNTEGHPLKTKSSPAGHY